MSVRDLKEQAARVRTYWRSRPNVTLSAEGATLLSMMESLPLDGVVVSRMSLEDIVRVLDGCCSSCAAMNAADELRAIMGPR